MLTIKLREKYSSTKFFPVRIFPYSGRIRRDTSSISVFSAITEKYRSEKTPYLDTFHTLLVYKRDLHCDKEVKLAFFIA